MYIRIPKPIPRGWPSGPVVDGGTFMARFLLPWRKGEARGFPLAREQSSGDLCGRGGSRGRRRRRLALPVAVERALDLHEPDDPADDRKEPPEADPAAERRLLPVGLVHLADLGGRLERHDPGEHDPDHEPEDAAHADARVLLDLLARLVDPVQAVDPERDDHHQDSEADDARLSERPRRRGWDVHRAVPPW